MSDQGTPRWWEFDSYFGVIEIQAPTEGEAYELFTKLMKRLFLLSHFIELAFDKNHARPKEPQRGRKKTPPAAGGTH